MALVPVPGAPIERADDPHIELTDADAFDDGGARMSFLEHLDELRKRLIASVIAILVGCVVSFIFIGRVFEFIFAPLRQMIPDGGTFAATEAPEVFMLTIKAGALGGLFVALPFVMWQLWLFIAPGLYAHEKKFAVPFVLFASVFFFAGAYFAHYVAFPWTFQYFLSYDTAYIEFMPRLGPTFGLYVKMVLGFGAIFQMPMVVLFLARFGMITAGFLVRNFKYAVLTIFVIAAVISPGGDVVSQAMMAGPMLVLYGVSILIAWIVAPRTRKSA